MLSGKCGCSDVCVCGVRCPLCGRQMAPKRKLGKQSTAREAKSRKTGPLPLAPPPSPVMAAAAAAAADADGNGGGGGGGGSGGVASKLKNPSPDWDKLQDHADDIADWERHGGKGLPPPIVPHPSRAKAVEAAVSTFEVIRRANPSKDCKELDEAVEMLASAAKAQLDMERKASKRNEQYGRLSLRRQVIRAFAPPMSDPVDASSKTDAVISFVRDMQLGWKYGHALNGLVDTEDAKDFELVIRVTDAALASSTGGRTHDEIVLDE
jgi:hypothetical protein